jgi:hypothetical protein
MIPASNASTAAARKTAALKCLPAREELINSTSLLMNALLSSVSSAGCGQRAFSCAIAHQTLIILPRQARDKDRKVEVKTDGFLQDAWDSAERDAAHIPADAGADEDQA